MRERDYPKFGAFPYHDLPQFHIQAPQPVHSSDAWAKELAGIDQQQAADIERAIEEAAMTNSDVHLYRKIGSQFLGIGIVPGSGSRVMVFEHPTIGC
jgi:hypothetical protein